MDLTIATQPYGDATIVAPTGELDVHTAPHLREAVVEAERRGTDIDVIVDLSAVTFMDSTGLGVLVGALARSREDGHRLVLCGVSGRIRRLLELTGLQTEFELADSASDARRP